MSEHYDKHPDTPHWVNGLHEHIRESEERIIAAVGPMDISLEDKARLQDALTRSERITKRLELVAKHLKALDKQTP